MSLTESRELPSWTTKCGAETLKVVQVTLDDGEIVWRIDNGKSIGADLHWDTFEEVKYAFDVTRPIFESSHQLSGCCLSLDYTLGPTREISESEEKFAYATPCAKQSLSIVRKTTMTGRDVWDVTNGHDDHPVAMMYETFESAKEAYETAVEMIKLLHGECCVISDHSIVCPMV